MNDIDPKVKAAIDQARDVFAGTKDGVQALDYLVEVLKAAPAAAAPTKTQVLVKLAVEVDASQLDAALAKAEQLRALTAAIHMRSMLSQVVIDASAGHQIDMEQTAINAARAFAAGIKTLEELTPQP